MAEDKVLQIIIKAKDAASKTLDNINEKIKEQEGLWDRMSRTIRRAGAVITGVSTGIAVALYKTAEYWDATRRAQVALEQAFKSMPQLVNENINAWYAWVEAMEEKLAVDDAELNRMGVYLSTLGLNVKQMQKLIPLIVDLSRKYQIDYQIATKAVVRAIQGETFMLERYGIMLDVSAAKTEHGIDTTKSYELVVKQLTTTVGGYSDILTREGVLATERFHIVMDNLKETMGQVITEAFMPLLDDLSQFIYLLQKNNHALIINATKIAAVASAIGLVAGPLMMIIGNLKALIGALTGLINPYVAAAAAIAGFLTYLYKTDEGFRQLVNTILKHGMQAVNWVMENWPAIADIIGQTLQRVLDLIRTILQPAADLIVALYSRIVDWTKENWGLIQATIATVMHAIQATIQAVSDAIALIWQQYGEQLTTIATNVWQAIQTTIKTVLDLILDALKLFMQVITGDWQGALETLKDMWRTTWEAIKSIGMNLWEAIKAAFSIWLDALQKTAQVAWQGLVNLVQGFVNKTRNIWEPALNTLLKIWKAVWGAMEPFIRPILTLIRGTIEATLKLIKGDWSGAWDTIKETLKTAFNQMQAAVLNGAGKLGQAMKALAKAIADVFVGLAKQAYQWGVNMIQMFINGIKSKIADLYSWVEGIAAKINNILGFHSPPKEGPLSDSDKWMPRMMQMFAAGMEKGLIWVKGKAYTVAEAMNNALLHSQPKTLPVEPTWLQIAKQIEQKYSGKALADYLENIRKQLESGALAKDLLGSGIPATKWQEQLDMWRQLLHYFYPNNPDYATPATGPKDIGATATGNIADAVYQAMVKATETTRLTGSTEPCEIRLEIDGQTFARLIYDYLKAEAARRGDVEVVPV